ncbi:hypothetical protein GP486_005025 [Trichoglossum hirsutum]|uniref:Uncharacterized protein n=1 Tax=Trichoglossum hirsutum TaxID=265104 RepID=A0A9P8LA15_9PEZI|nr:hypothetical protein GP486_005025 [Trichoglossum hirsutum]
MASSAGLRRQNSARDKAKRVPELSGPALKRSTSHLVVCGATNHKRDNWLFGDFLGFVDALKKANPPIHGDFINCFPLGEYFASSGKEDVKFGRRKEAGGADWDSGDEIAIYNRWQYDHREAWWMQVGQPMWPSTKPNILKWIDGRVHDAKPGDIVTIILIGHGNQDGIDIAGVLLSASELAAACANFSAGVQVNIIIKACSSGAFAKAFRVSGQRNLYVHTSSKDASELSFSDRRSITGRIRNSLFGASFVETLGLMRDPEELWTLGKQKQKLEDDLSGPLVPPSRRSLPKVVSDSPEKRMMWDILYRDYVDISFDRAPSNARRILTPPDEALRIHRQQRIPSALPEARPESPPVASYTAAEAVLRRELEYIDTDWPEGGDMGIIERIFSLDGFSKDKKHSAIEELVRALAYRFRVQEEIFIVAESLMYLGLLSHRSLYLPMRLSQRTEAVATVFWALQCFAYVEDATSFTAGEMGKYFEAAALWLATVIVRSCTDWTRILDRLVTIKRLGSLDQDRATELAVRGPRFAINPHEGEEKEIWTPQYGFWLPHGVSMRDFAGKFFARYCAVKEAYEGVVGEGAWGDSSMLEAAVTWILAAERESPDSGYGTLESP